MIDLKCKEIIRELGIRQFVETGTDMGETIAQVCRWFSEIYPLDFGRITGEFQTGAKSYNAWNEPIKYPVFKDAPVSTSCRIHSIDTDRYSFEKARRNFSTNPNVMLHLASSDRFLKEFIDSTERSDSNATMFFLDAHWGDYWPIRGEIAQIKRMKKYVIVIDDFFVPGKSIVSSPRKGFGFDFYGSNVLCWGYIRESFGDSCPLVYYSPEPNRDQRGWVVIAGGYSKEELGFLENMGFQLMLPDDPRHIKPIRPTLKTKLDYKVMARTLLPLNWVRGAVRVVQKIKSIQKTSSPLS